MVMEMSLLETDYEDNERADEYKKTATATAKKEEEKTQSSLNAF